MQCSEATPFNRLRVGSMNDFDRLEESQNNRNRAFELQMRMFEKGIDMLENQISRLDDVLFKIKASTITVWIAIIGWALTNSNPQIIVLGFVAIVGFWNTEAIFRGVQLRYIDRVHDATKLLNDIDQLSVVFTNKAFQSNQVYSIGVGEGQLTKGALLVRGLFSPSVFVTYFVLFSVNILSLLVVLEI